jgi:uncharacterized protein YcsI (UPF0317 family)
MTRNELMWLLLHLQTITGKYPRVHGAPVHLGDAASIGIEDIKVPDYGDAVTVGNDEIPVFWACGVTPQAVVMASRWGYLSWPTCSNNFSSQFYYPCVVLQA